MYIIKNGNHYLISINIHIAEQKEQRFTASYSSIGGAIKINDYGQALVIRDLIQSWENNYVKGRAETVTIKEI